MKHLFIIIIVLGIAIIGCGTKQIKTIPEESPPQNDSQQKTETVLNGSSIPSQDEFIPIEKYPEMVSEVTPIYPAKALKMSVEGTVIVEAYVDRRGSVLQAQSKECTKPGYGFEEAAVNAAYKYKFKPAIQDGKPIGCWVSYAVKFEF